MKLLQIVRIDHGENVGRYDKYAWIDRKLMSLNYCEWGWEVVNLVLLLVEMLILVLMVAYVVVVVVVGDWRLRMLCVLRRDWDKEMFEMVGM